MPRPRLGAEPLTNQQKQARRREQFRRMRDALEAILGATSLREAKRIAAEAMARAHTEKGDEEK